MAANLVASGIQNSLNFLTQPPRRPLRRLLVWYALVGGLGTVLSLYVPIVQRAIASGPIPGMTPQAGNLLNLPAWPPAEGLTSDLLMMIVMVGTLLLSIPVSWGYMAIRERDGFDQSVVQTIVMLPVVVAAIMMIVQHSLALAFALAGVSAAVRFRNTLKDVADATYVFLALGIGMAGGVGKLGSAAVMSFIFIFLSVLLWRCNYGCPVGDTATAGSGSGDASAGGQASRNGVLSVQVTDAGVDRSAIESVLDLFTKTWVLDRMEPEEDGGALVRYRVRLRKGVESEIIVHEVLFHGEDLVAAATFDAI